MLLSAFSPLLSGATLRIVGKVNTMPLSLSQGICCFSDILSNVAILAAHVQMYYCRAISFHGHTLQSFALSKQYRIHCFQLDNSYPKHIKISMLRILQLKTAGVLHTSIKSAISCIPDYFLHLHLFCWSVIVHSVQRPSSL